MDIMLKASAGVLIALVLCQLLNHKDKNIAILLVITVCCMVIGAVLQYFKPVLTLLEKLESIGNLNSDIVKIMLKATGIGLLAEITSLICNDAGDASLGRAIQIMASGVILWICIPVFTELITLVENILGAV